MNKLKLEEINYCRKIFEELDVEETGTIDYDSFGIALEKINFLPQEKQLNKLISELDQDNSGSIKFQDFLKLFQKIKQTNSQNLDDSDTLDAYVALGGSQDKTGNIDGKLLIKIIKEQFQLPIDIQKLINEIDDSGDGLLQYDQFQNLLQKKHKNIHFQQQ